LCGSGFSRDGRNASQLKPLLPGNLKNFVIPAKAGIQRLQAIESKGAGFQLSLE